MPISLSWLGKLVLFEPLFGYNGVMIFEGQTRTPTALSVALAERAALLEQMVKLAGFQER